MPMELQRSALYWGKQVAKGTELTTPSHRGLQVAGDFGLNRDVGSVRVSDGSKYGSQVRFLNAMNGAGTPGIEATPSELGSLLWLTHGSEVFTAGTNNVWTLAGAPASGTFNLVIDDGAQLITVTGVANTVTAAALATSINAAMTAAGHTGTPVATGGGPLNTTAVTVTFSGTTTAARAFTLTKANDTTSPAVTLTNTTPGVRGKHTFTPQSTAGHWATFVRSVGTSVVARHSQVDCLIGGFVIEASGAQKDMRITPNLFSLNPFKVVASDPAAALPTGIDARPFIWQEAQGTLTLGTGAGITVMPSQSAMTLTVNEDRSPAYGDDAVPYDFAVGTPTVAVSITMGLDANGYARWNELVYGTATPATGATPLRGLPSAGSWSGDWKQKSGSGNLTGNEVKVTLPAINWDAPELPAPNPGGGLAEVTLTGELAPTTTPYTLEVWNGDNAAYTA